METKLKFGRKQHVGYQPLTVEIRGEPELVKKLVDTIHKETETWKDFEEY